MGMGAWEPGISYLAYAQTDASTFAYIMSIGDSVGVVNFNTSAYYCYPSDGSGVVTISSQAIQDTAVSKIGALSATGLTNISDAISKGSHLLAGAGTPKAMILLSDGDWNRGTDPTQNLPNIPIHTIALGNHGEINTLQTIAANTGASYHLSPTPFDLMDVYNEIVNSAGVAQTLANKEKNVPRYKTEITNGVYPAGASQAIFSVNWSDFNVKYTDKTPVGNQVNVSILDPEHKVVATTPIKIGSGYVVFKIPNPMEGQYASAVWYSGSGSLNSTMGIFDPDTDMSLDAGVESNGVHVGGDLHFHARVLDNGKPVPNATIRASVEAPLISPKQALLAHMDRLDTIKSQGPNGELSDNAKMMALQFKVGPCERLLPYGSRVIGFEKGPDKDGYHRGKLSTEVPGGHIFRFVAEGYSLISKRPFKFTRRISAHAFSNGK
jgi:hypothetical protein